MSAPPRPLKALAVLACLAGAAAKAEDPEPFAYTVVDAARIPVPLGGLMGDAGRGAALFAAECATCHGDTAAGEPLPEDPETGTLRLAIVHLGIARPVDDTTLPDDHAFYHPDDNGLTRLPAQAIEDIVAYLAEQPG